jgi:hypothetical protein
MEVSILRFLWAECQLPLNDVLRRPTLPNIPQSALLRRLDNQPRHLPSLLRLRVSANHREPSKHQSLRFWCTLTIWGTRFRTLHLDYYFHRRGSRPSHEPAKFQIPVYQRYTSIIYIPHALPV